MSLSSDFWLGDYDKMDDRDLNTQNFTKLDEIEIIKSEEKESHPFLHFLRGFSHELFDYEIIHGWTHSKSKNAKFYVRMTRSNNSNIGGLLIHAWRKYVRDINAEVSIYTAYCGQLYKANDFEIDEAHFYKEFINKMIEKL